MGKFVVQQYYPHWQYFLALESEFAVTTRYVEVSQKNFGTFSTELVRLLLGASSEIDVLLKLLCERLNPSASPKKIDDYRSIVSAGYPKFADIRILIPRYGMAVQPWVSWRQNINPDWWRRYNDVKHERNKYYGLANLEMVLPAMAGLFTVVLYFYKDALYSNELMPKASLFALEKEPSLSIVGGYELPDFPLS